jgi:hypothetical protein
MKIKPVRPSDLLDAWSDCLKCVVTLTESGNYPATEDGQSRYWQDVADALQGQGLSHDLVVRSIGFMWIMNEIKPVPTLEIRREALYRAALAPIDPVTFAFRYPASLFPHL